MPPLLPAASFLGRIASISWSHFFLWAGSLVASIALIVLLRCRWGQTRPLQKCAVLSLLVHLILAWVAMTVRYVAGDGGGGSGPPIRVRVVNEASGPIAMANFPDASSMDEVAPPDIAAPPLLERPPDPIEEPSPEKTPPVPEPIDAPTTTEPEAAAKVAEIVPAVPDETAQKAADDAGEETAMTKSESDVVEAPNPTETAATPALASTPSQETPVQTTPASVGPAVVESATPYSLRTAPGRLGLVESEGGSAQTEAAVGEALRWLAAAQARDGRWDANQFGAGQEQAVLGHNRGGAGRGADTGISALALLAFLGAGHTHLEGEYQDNVRRGLDFLLRSQAADGSLFGDATLYAQMYCHSMATFALAEAQAMSGDARLQPAVTKAVNYCVAAQNASTGGWRYRPGDIGDTSQLGWQMMALASAERAGIRLPSHTWIRVERFLRSVRRGNYGGLASYRPDSGPTTSMTAEALYCRLMLSEVLDVALEESAAEEASGAVLAALPESGRVNLYYWYYATLALHYRHQQHERAASDWYAWNEALTTALLATQVTDGADAGSWNTNTVWGGYGGRVYTTAMAAMCLEVYYRYAPPAAPRGRWTASRPETPLPSR